MILEGDSVGRTLQEDPYHRIASFVTNEQLISGTVELVINGDGTPMF